MINDVFGIGEGTLSLVKTLVDGLVELLVETPLGGLDNGVLE